ncbi:MAG: chorismate-binding protein, partial [Chloroflexi bacterium]|nr:chorismate-binding protein [Chloroflexota bacterium]
MDARNRNILIEEIHTPLAATEVFELFHSQLHSFFLNSGMDPQRLGRYSFIGVDPFLVMRSRGNQSTIIRQDRQENEQGNPFDILDKLLKRYSLDSFPAPIPFWGGAVGYLSYDLCHFIERLPTTAIDDLELPESYFGFYDTVLAFDNLENRAYIASTGFPELDESRRLKRARVRLEEMKSRLSSTPSNIPEIASESAKKTTEAVLKSNFTPEGYMEAVNRVREYIAAGDVFQVNISQRFETELTISPYELYRRLGRINPAPFASYLNFDGITIVSASPERFLRVGGDWIETRPIKGTNPRGKNPVEDDMLAQEGFCFEWEEIKQDLKALE